MRKVRIEEICVCSKQNYEFSPNVWIESDLEYGDTLYIENDGWIVVEVPSE